MRRAAAGLVFAALTLLAAPARAQTRTEVPIRAVTLSDGVVRYGLPVLINGAPALAGLDTGAQGLRLKPDAPGREASRPTTTAETYAFGSGAQLHGQTGKITLTLGALSGDIRAHLVDQVDCVVRQPDCPGRLGLGYGFLGDGLAGEGFKVLLGTNMGRTTLDQPLAALGARRWIVELPRPGEADNGRLILNPTEDEAAGFTWVRLIGGYRREGGGLDDAIWGCIRSLAASQRFCGPALLDTGAALVRVNNASGDAHWAKDAPIELDFRNDAARAAVSLRLTAGGPAQVIRFTTAPIQGVVLQVGVAPYLAYSVLYDTRGRIGFKARTPIPDLPQPVDKLSVAP